MSRITIKIERSAPSADAVACRRGVRRTALVALPILAAVSAFLATTGLAGAKVISIPPTTIVNNVTLASNGQVSPVVIAGSTTVPSDATRVQMAVTISGATASGKVSVAAAGSPVSEKVAYISGMTTNANVYQPVGLNNKDTFTNLGTKGIKLTVQIIGYSTEVRTTDISPANGTAGQVLTNTGTGAAWQPVSHAYGTAYLYDYTVLTKSAQTVESVTVPAGSYQVSFITTIAELTASSQPDFVECDLFSPGGGANFGLGSGNTDTSNTYSTISVQGLVATAAGGPISAECYDENGSTEAVDPSLIATTVGAVSGYAGANPVHGKSLPSNPSGVNK